MPPPFLSLFHLRHHRDKVSSVKKRRSRQLFFFFFFSLFFLPAPWRPRPLAGRCRVPEAVHRGFFFLSPFSPSGIPGPPHSGGVFFFFSSPSSFFPRTPVPHQRKEGGQVAVFSLLSSFFFPPMGPGKRAIFLFFFFFFFSPGLAQLAWKERADHPFFSFSSPLMFVSIPPACNPSLSLLWWRGDLSERLRGNPSPFSAPFSGTGSQGRGMRTLFSFFSL